MPLYFIAIVAPDEVNQRVLEWKKYMFDRYHCKKALRSPAHITLIAPFTGRREMEMHLVPALMEFAGNQSAMVVHLKDFAAFAPKVIYVKVEENLALHRLKGELEDFLIIDREFPMQNERRPYNPHLTIASGDLQAGDFASAWSHFGALKYETTFVASAISLLIATGVRWEVLTACPLFGFDQHGP